MSFYFSYFLLNWGFRMLILELSQDMGHQAIREREYQGRTSGDVLTAEEPSVPSIAASLLPGGDTAALRVQEGA